MFRWLFPTASSHRQRLQAFARNRPWLNPAPADALRLRGMLGHGESLLFFHLARDAFSGQGEIVDAGSFLGKSASLFASGLRGNRSLGRHGRARKIHCFDNFLVNEEGTAAFIREHCGRAMAIGDSTREIFEEQVRPVRSLLEVHAGDFLETRWSGAPIEILMVDVAKSRRLWTHLLKEMFPRLIPGVSVVVHQDYHHPWLPHLHIAMERLKDHFELLVPRVDSSAVFLCTSPIPEEAVRTCGMSGDLGPAELVALFDRAVQRMPVDDRLVLELTRGPGASVRNRRGNRKAFIARPTSGRLQRPSTTRHGLVVPGRAGVGLPRSSRAVADRPPQ